MKRLILVLAAVFSLALPAQATAGTLDQQQTNVAGGRTHIFGPGDTGLSARSLAQTFTAGISGALDQVDLYLDREASTEEPLTVEIRDVVGATGAPGTSVLASASVPAASVPTVATGFFAVGFASPPSVTAGTKYAIVAYVGGDGRYFWWRGTCCASGDLYPGGGAFDAFESPPSSWFSAAFDLAFQTYVIPAATIADLIAAVEALDLPGGIENSLLSKLTGAQNNLQADDTVGACDKLASFIAAVQAQSGKKIDADDADALIDDAEEIRDSIPC
jgi:hypothetical protein